MLDLMTPIVPQYKYFNSISKESELEEMSHNPWIKINDIIYCEENQSYYAFNTIFDENGEAYNTFTVVSEGDQNLEQCTFFHAFNIKDKVKLSNDKEGTIVDIRYSLTLKDAVYVIVFEDKTKSEIPASMMDGQKIKKYLPMSALL